MEGLLKSKIVSVDSAKSGKASPILATFQNANLTDEMCRKAICKRVETVKDGRKYALIATDSNVYKADITEDSPHQDTYLTIHNKDTREIKLIQVQKASFKHVIYDNTRTIFDQNVVDANRLLYKEYGGKKASSSYERNQKTQINSKILEDTVDKMMEKVDDKIFENNEEQAKDEKPVQSIFPKIKGNVEGKSVREIFSLENLLGKDTVESLFEISIDTLKLDPKELKFTNKYLKEAAQGLQVSKTPESRENLSRMSMLIYAEMLTALINNRKKPSEVPKLLHDFSPRLQQDVLNNFYVHGSQDYSNFTRQKSIIFYTILVLLSTQKLEITMNELLDGINLPKRELIKFVTVLGCKVKGDLLQLHKIAKLDKDSQFSVPTLKTKKERRN